MKKDLHGHICICIFIGSEKHLNHITPYLSELLDMKTPGMILESAMGILLSTYLEQVPLSGEMSAAFSPSKVMRVQVYNITS